MLLTNVTGASARAVALWYYWRWRIETYHELLKGAGHQAEQSRQESAAAFARRLLVTAMAAVVVAAPPAAGTSAAAARCPSTGGSTSGCT